MLDSWIVDFWIQEFWFVRILDLFTCEIRTYGCLNLGILDVLISGLGDLICNVWIWDFQIFEFMNVLHLDCRFLD